MFLKISYVSLAKIFECDKFLYRPKQIKIISLLQNSIKEQYHLIICGYKSVNSTIDKNDLLNQTNEDVLTPKERLLVLDFN